MEQKTETRKASKPLPNDQQAKDLVAELMRHITAGSCATDLLDRVKKMPFGTEIQKNMPGEKFPRLELRITPKEISELQAMGVLTDDLKLSPILASGKLSSNQPLSALEKLMYAVLWKNGDLGKEHHMASGVYGQGHAQKTGTVFYEFGGYLSGRNSFIMDQHTLRCFAVVASEGYAIKQARQLETINGKNDQHGSWMKSYMAFYKQLEAKMEDYLYVVDKLFFGAGKFIKINR